jgi:hypothetical protein
MDVNNFQKDMPFYKRENIKNLANTILGNLPVVIGAGSLYIFLTGDARLVPEYILGAYALGSANDLYQNTF